MPTVRLTYVVKPVVVSEDAYTVEFQVLDAEYIEPAIFVFDSNYSAFTGVATPYDMLTWPVAQNPDLMSFRAIGVVRTYTSIEDAEAFIAVTRGRIESLRLGWQAYLDAFPSEYTVVTPS